MLAGLPEHGHQWRRDLQSTRDMPEIEGHHRPDEVRPVGRFKTVPEGLHPL